MKKKKGCLTGLCIALVVCLILMALAIVGVITLWDSAHTQSVAEKFFAFSYEKFLTESYDVEYLKDYYPDVMRSEKSAKKMEEKIISIISEYTPGTVETAQDNLNYNFLQAQLIMEHLGYKNENVRAAFDQRQTEYLREHIRKGNWTFISKISDAEGLSFYHTPQELITDQLLAEATESMRQEVLSCEDINAVMEYAAEIAEFQKTYPNITADLLLPADQFISKITKDAALATASDNAGGYYDSQKHLYENSEKIEDEFDIDVANIRKVYHFYGDFMIREYYKIYIRENGTELEEEILSEYDEQRISLYYCDEVIADTDEDFRKAISADSTVYIKDGYYFVVGANKVICFIGNHTFALNYAEIG